MSQCVKIGNFQSSFVKINKGVPQGSVLGPTPFTIYINDIASSWSNCNFHLYADDIVLYTCADSIHAATHNLQQSFSLLQKHLHNLKLVLNCEKTKQMLFTNASHIDYEAFEICAANNSIIKRAQYYKYLGIWMDKKFSFRVHIDMLLKKLRPKLGFLYRNKSCFPLFTWKRILEAVFLSVLDFGDIVYGQTANSALKPWDALYSSDIIHQHIFWKSPPHHNSLSNYTDPDPLRWQLRMSSLEATPLSIWLALATFLDFHVLFIFQAFSIRIQTESIRSKWEIARQRERGCSLEEILFFFCSHNLWLTFVYGPLECFLLVTWHLVSPRSSIDISVILSTNTTLLRNTRKDHELWSKQKSCIYVWMF